MLSGEQSNPVFGRRQQPSPSSATAPPRSFWQRYKKKLLWTWGVGVFFVILFVVFAPAPAKYVPTEYTREGEGNGLSSGSFLPSIRQQEAPMSFTGLASQIASWNTSEIEGLEVTFSFEGGDLEGMGLSEVEEFKNEFTRAVEVASGLDEGSLYVLSMSRGSIVVNAFALCSAGDSCETALDAMAQPEEIFQGEFFQNFEPVETVKAEIATQEDIIKVANSLLAPPPPSPPPPSPVSYTHLTLPTIE